MKRLWERFTTPLESFPQMLKATSFFIALGIVILLFLLCITPTKTLAYYLVFVDDKDLSVEFSGTLSFLEAGLGNINEGKYHFKGALLAKTTVLNNSAKYHLDINKLSIHDHKGMLIIAYENHGNRLVEYSTDSRWSDKKRAAIYQAFKVDFTETRPADDSSLFHEHMSLCVNTTGKIEQILLSPQLSDAIYSSTATSIGGKLLRSFLRDSKQIPGLFSPTKNHIQWHTNGNLFGRISLEHKVVNYFGDLLHIRSQISPDNSDSIHNKGLVARSFTLDWRYDKKRHFIPSIDIEVSSSLKRNLLNTQNSYNYDLKINLLLSHEKQKRIIDEEI